MEMFSLSRIICAWTSYWRCTVLVIQATVRPRSSNTGKPARLLTTVPDVLGRDALPANLSAACGMVASLNESTFTTVESGHAARHKQVVLSRLILAQIMLCRCA